MIGLMVFAFFFLMFVESEWPFSVTAFADVGGIFSPMFSSLTVWLTLLLALGSSVTRLTKIGNGWIEVEDFEKKKKRIALSKK